MADEEGRGEVRRTRAVVDRVEDGEVAVVYVGEGEGVAVDLPASMLPEGAGEGSHLTITVRLEEGATRSAEDRIRALQERLERRGKGQ